MILQKLNRPIAETKSDYDRELWDALERFSYDVELLSKLAFNINSSIVSGDVTLGNENMIFIDASSGDVTVGLPPLSASKGRIYWIKRTDSSANIVTVDGNGSETIDGETTQILCQYDCMTITPSLSEWSII